MAHNLGDLNNFLDPGMTFNIGPKEYRIPPVSWEIGLWGRKVAALGLAPADKVGPDAWEEIGEPPLREGYTLEDELLSKELIAELAADGVPDPAIKHLMAVAYAQLVSGDEFATAVFQGNVGGPTNRQERRAAQKATPKKAASSSRTTSTAGAGTTRKPASGSGTSGRKAAKPPAKAASRGRKS